MLTLTSSVCYTPLLLSTEDNPAVDPSFSLQCFNDNSECLLMMHTATNQYLDGILIIHYSKPVKLK